jgi:hypothetical protein
MPDLKKSNPKRGNSFLIAGILSAIGASICCVGPLLLLALGVSGAWIGSLTALEPELFCPNRCHRRTSFHPVRWELTNRHA